MDPEKDSLKKTDQPQWKNSKFRSVAALFLFLLFLHVCLTFFWYQNSKPQLKLISFFTVIICTITVMFSVFCFGHGRHCKYKALGAILVYMTAITIGLWYLMANGRGNLHHNERECIVLPPKSSTAKQVLPQSVIIGVRKAGTSALRKYLQLHSKIVVTEKEPNFFSLKYDKGIEWYRKCMPYSENGQLTIEKSSNNFHNYRSAERMFLMNSTIKLILVVREPVERAISDFTQRVVVKKNMSTFDELFENIKSGTDTGTFNSIKPSLYGKHMKKWLKYFPLKQIHIVDGDNLIANPYQEVHQVESFLGLDHEIDENRFVYNATKGFYCFRNEAMQMECMKKGKGRTHVKVDQQIVRRLRQYLRPFNKAFFYMIKRTFDW